MGFLLLTAFSGDALTLRVEAPPDIVSHADLGSRDPARSSRKKAAPKKPKSPTKPRPSNKPVKTPTTAPKKTAVRTDTKKATASPAASVKLVVPLPFKPTPQSTKAFDVCDLPGFDCFSDADGRELGEIVKRAPKAAGSQPGESRPFKIDLASGPITLKSKDYWTSPELFDNSKTGLNLAEVYADYTRDNPRGPNTYKVKLFSTKPPGRTTSFVTEHIVEVSKST
jgi:hypothetical protein